MNTILQLDGAILLYIQDTIRAEWMNPFWIGVTHLGDSGKIWILLSLLLLIPKKTRGAGAAGLLALLIGALLTNVTLKNLVARIRPYEVVQGLQILIAKPHDFSFPSGHTCASFAAACAYFKMLPKKWAAAPMFLAVLISFSRLYIGVHYPTDVLAGALIGVLAAWVAAKIVMAFELKWKQRKGSRNIS